MAKKVKAGIGAGQRSLLSFWKTTKTSRSSDKQKESKDIDKKRKWVDEPSHSVMAVSKTKAREKTIGENSNEGHQLLHCDDTKIRTVSPNEKPVPRQEPSNDKQYNQKNHELQKTESQHVSETDGDESMKDSQANGDTFSSDDESGAESETETSAAIATTDSGEHVLSDYELLRLKNIARNNARLVALGLMDKENLPTSRCCNAPRKQERRKKLKGTATTTPSLPTRRSTRIRNSGQTGVASNNQEKDNLLQMVDTVVAEPEQEEEQMEQFEVSPVVQYVMDEKVDDCCADGSITDKSSRVVVENHECRGQITSLTPVGSRLMPPQGLQAIYTMQFYSGSNAVNTSASDHKTWIVGAGKSGIVALWDCKRTHGAMSNDGIDPIMSWKAHGGRWISDARFLPGPLSSPSRLVTAANDGSVCLWNLTTVSIQSNAPKLQFRTNKELHTSGIFCMDLCVPLEQQPVICTGSKDKTIAISVLDSLSCNKAPLWRSNYHSAKVAAVKLRGKDNSILASASDDGHVAIHDYRSSGDGHPVAVLEGAHNRPHSVVWDPMKEHVFLTAGLDRALKTWDMRFLNQPLCTFYGHVSTTTKRCKKIHHPSFYSPSSENAFILSGGEGSNALSMFQSRHDKSKRSPVYSRGTMPSDCGDVGSIAVHGETVAASVEGGEILLLAPRFR